MLDTAQVVVGCRATVRVCTSALSYLIEISKAAAMAVNFGGEGNMLVLISSNLALALRIVGVQ